MTHLRVSLQPAYVLHQRAYRDTSAILELFTPEEGRVGVIAKGVRGNKPRWRGLLQAFQPLLVSWSQRGDLGLLTEAEAQGAALNINPRFIASGFYLNEVLMRLLHRHDAQLELFGCYDAALRELSALGAVEVKTAANRENYAESHAESQVDSSVLIELEVILRRFEMHLLSALGYGLVLDHDMHTAAPVQADQQYLYYVEHGPALADGQHDEASGLRVSGQCLLAMQADDWSADATRREAKRLLRAVLGHYLGPKPLQSRELMQQSAQLAQRVARSEKNPVAQ